MVTSQVQAKIYVLGYPKSGNNLLCYSLSNILHKPMMIEQNVFFLPNALGDVSKLGKHKSLSISEEELVAAMHFEHRSANLKLYEANPMDDYLIVIVRNYRECFIRYMLQEAQEAELLFKPQDVLNMTKQICALDSIPDCYNASAIDYINILRCYDEWNPKTRVLVYYEDLVEDFDATMEACLKKMNVDIRSSSFNEFLIQKKERFNESRETYRYGETMSGNNINHHTEKWLSTDIIKQIDEELRMNFPYFWHKYLSHYEYQEN